jgi:hypothetical protein
MCRVLNLLALVLLAVIAVESGSSMQFGEDFLPGIYVLKFLNGSNNAVYKLIKQ